MALQISVQIVILESCDALCITIAIFLLKVLQDLVRYRPKKRVLGFLYVELRCGPIS